MSSLIWDAHTQPKIIHVYEKIYRDKKCTKNVSTFVHVWAKD